MLIYPSILESSAEKLLNRVNDLSPFFSHFQIDIADGKFVSNKTVQIDDIEKSIKEKLSFTKVLAGKTFEFHLMVENYESEINKLEPLSKYLKISSVLIHIKSLNTKYHIQATRYEYGIVLNPEDEVVSNWEKIKNFKKVQIMTVHPGKQGAPFVRESLNKIDELRACGFAGSIILDGAINDQTLPIILKRDILPDAVAPGSYFRKDVAARLEKLKKLL